MTGSSTHRSRRRLVVAWALALAMAFSISPTATATATPPLVPSARHALPAWQWPIATPVSIAAPYDQPEHDYGSGHRGIDLWTESGNGTVAAPSSGTIAWVGSVADRPLLTIDHGGGLVTTLEPVIASVEIGTMVNAGETVGTTSSGGHTTPGAVHWGVRADGKYINPATLFSRTSRPILLPCCAAAP